MTEEDERLRKGAAREENWQRWGPYLSERQWGTVREDYSEGGDATWSYFPHDHARSRAYRWGEDGLLGLCDRECRLCFSVALWNGRDPILKERLFGLTGPEGNHGEDVKECYYYLDATPTTSYAKGLYKYPQTRYPYERLKRENRDRGRLEPEFELADTGIFNESRYFDVTVEYAKASPDDILIRLSVVNRGPEPATLYVLPQFFFRNTWTWECTDEGCTSRPSMRRAGASVQTFHESLHEFWFACDRVGANLRTDTVPADAPPDGSPAGSADGSPAGSADGSADVPHEDADGVWLFTDNETNRHRHPGLPSESDYFKDAFQEYVVAGNTRAVNPQGHGTKAAANCLLRVSPGATEVIRLRLSGSATPIAAGRCDGDATRFRGLAFGGDFESTFRERVGEADAYYATRIPTELSDQRRAIMRQAYAGLLWTKQFYHYVVRTWIEGDPNGVSVPDSRAAGRNAEWRHLFNRDVISMPDKWEYPWYAAWDLAFHMVPMARLDTHFAKQQMVLFLREWYLHPNGMLPAYEWHLSDVNPPVHAWGVWEVYKASGPPRERDKVFLARCFQKLLLNFTWWVNRKDPRGRNIFSGGFLGLDNIGVFDRSKPLPRGHLEQADGTAWMAFYCGTMLQIAIELAEDQPAYGDMASKFFEHYIAIAEAMNTIDGTGLWDKQDEFYYDHLYVDGRSTPIRVRSLVGLLPLTTGVLLEESIIENLPGFMKRTRWFLEHRGDLASMMTYMEREDPTSGANCRRLLAIPSEPRFRRLLAVMLDEDEFLSPFGIRSLSAAHGEHPFVFDFGGQRNEVRYLPGESDSGMFGGNSNWRGPIWFPTNYLLIQSLKRYHDFYGDGFRVECPTGSGHLMTLRQVAEEIERRLARLFEADADGNRPAHGGEARYRSDPAWKDLHLFYEYFDADSGKGHGASHQTGWTALIATILGANVTPTSRR